MDKDPLLEGFLAFGTPKGFKAELLDGEIVVTPPPVGRHEKSISRLIAQVAQGTSAELDVACNMGLILPSGGDHPDDRVIPDATFGLAELDIFDDEESWVAPEGVAMVVEVTVKRADLAERDRVAKRYGYARGGIPLYLLVDRERREVTLFSQPEDGDYRRSSGVSFGRALALPGPFGFELDTADFC
ncbi:Uma2 family endonuclease [Actinomadura fibrosa]|uniref:Uma2 family endonuclease n=1 Tax=Actinomadura fibrosa TaxID=111802 RepID=A0ABW2XE19_9ACTN|nr:Uma2 family endonuclease [Actinomadura fibrosa]